MNEGSTRNNYCTVRKDQMTATNWIKQPLIGSHWNAPSKRWHRDDELNEIAQYVMCVCVFFFLFQDIFNILTSRLRKALERAEDGQIDFWRNY